jgi:16S rRNA (cytosine1402-N4)-methyltransferase
MRHIPVLLQEVIRYLAPSAGEVILDATVNRGGHAQAIAEHIGPAGTLVGLDLDATAIQAAKTALANVSARILLRVSNYRRRIPRGRA